MIDVYLRKINPTPAVAYKSFFPGCASITEYGLNDHAGELLKQLQASAATHVLFADNFLDLTALDWASVAAFAQQDAHNAFTFPHAGVNTINTNPFKTLPPSWCCLVPKKYLTAASYSTTEFILLSAVYRHNISLKVHPGGALSFDARQWTGQLLMGSLENLSKDYAAFCATEGTGAEKFIPPQFRLTSNHVNATPGLPDEAQRQAGFPRFSIICPVFKPDFLQAMIDSVIAQTWPHWELLMGVDGPAYPDEKKILSILSAQTDERIQYFVQSNKGTGPTRKILAGQASGDFIFSMDDDDMIVPNALEVFAGAVRSNPGARVFRGSTRIIGLVDQELAVRKRYLINGISNDPFEVNQPYIIERNLLESVGGYEWDTSLHNAGEDTILFHKLDQLHTPVYLLHLPLYLRRLSTKNLTLQFRVNEAMDHFRNIDERFTPEGWRNTGRRFSMDGNFQCAIASYAYLDEEVEVTTATRFFQYQTLGSFENLTIDLEVTSRCNAVCGFCPRDAMPDKKTHVSLETVTSLAENLRHGPQKQVVLCGIGESLMHPQIVSIVDTLNKAGAFVAMTTNGALLTEELFRKLIHAGLRSINFSVNAASAGVHQQVMGMKNYDKVIANIHTALRVREELFPQMRVHVSCVICEENEHEVDTFVRQWRDTAVTQVWLHPVNNRAGLLGLNIKSVHIGHFFTRYAGDPKVVVDVFRDHEEKEHLCKIAKGLAFISSDGNMRLCAMDYQRVTSYGNINEKSLQQLQFEKLLDYARGTCDSFCQNCDFCPSEKKNKLTTAL